MLVKSTFIVAVAVLLIIFTTQVRSFSPFEASNVSRSIEKYEVDWVPSVKLSSALVWSIFRGIYTSIVPYDNTRDPTESCNCSCGITSDMYPSRIVGGHETELKEHPWMAQFWYLETSFCGGTLINPRYVLTAAHCANRYFVTMIKVTLGSVTNNACHKSDQSWSSYVSSVKSPALSGSVIFGQDIALLRLENRAPINELIQPICLPTPSHDYANQNGIVAGWGRTRENGNIACNLQSVELPILSNSDCFQNTFYTNVSRIMATDYMMCAGKEGIDSCSGDSGGPLSVKRKDGRYEIVGVVSFGLGCGRENAPGVYTRVTKYLDWIQKNTQDACFCEN